VNPRAIVCAASAFAAALVTQGVDARVEAESRYSKPQTFSGALRYLRVELGYEVVEKDADAAYLLFRYPAPGKRDSTQGSIEVVEAGGAVRVFVQMPQSPEYQERLLRDGLLRKLRQEYGEPAKPAPAPPADAKEKAAAKAK
jgi:hypothetical protein